MSASGAGIQKLEEGWVERPSIAIIVAASNNGIIGRDGKLPWRLSADLARFKQLTMGHAIIMGRKTFESIGRPLPGRLSIVLTHNSDWRTDHEEVKVVSSLEEALELVSQAEGFSSERAFVIGGGEIYRLALAYADKVFLTRVHTTIEGDATFPALDKNEWRLVGVEKYDADEKNEHAYAFEEWQRAHE